MVEGERKLKPSELRDLIQEHRGQREVLWTKETTTEHDEWFVDVHMASDSELYGVHSKEFWVSTSRGMMILTYILLVVLIVCVMWQFIMYQFETHVIAWTIGAVFVALAIPLSLQDIHMHVLHYVSPLQRHYIRILWMVPIYAVESWLALRFNKQKVYLETAREAYEAYVVYSLYKLMREFLGDKPRAVAKLAKLAEKKGRKTAHMLWPCCKMTPWRLDAQFLTRTALGVWQYVLIRTALATTAMILEAASQMNHMYGEGSFSFTKFYVYNVIVLNISQCWALWCLVLFYHELKDELAPIKPLGKFLVVKAVVFFSWWQQIIVTGLASAEVIHPIYDYTGEDVAKAIQNLLVCIEMLGYALLHKVIFSYTDFRAGGPLALYMADMDCRQKHTKDAMKDMLPMDVIMEGTQYVVKAKKLIDKKIHRPQDAALEAATAKGEATPADGEAVKETVVEEVDEEVEVEDEANAWEPKAKPPVVEAVEEGVAPGGEGEGAGEDGEKAAEAAPAELVEEAAPPSTEKAKRNMPLVHMPSMAMPAMPSMSKVGSLFGSRKTLEKAPQGGERAGGAGEGGEKPPGDAPGEGGGEKQPK